MIHWTPECNPLKRGLNFRGTLKGRCWLTVIWYNYNRRAAIDYGWFFRVCLKGSPHIYCRKLGPYSLLVSAPVTVQKI